jgi:hypothetical protein
MTVALLQTPDSRPASNPDQLHEHLARLASWRLEPATAPSMSIREELELRELESVFLEKERQAIASRAAEAPLEADAFMEWYAALRQNGPGQFDPFFDWLEREADVEAMRWFVFQELSGEAGFDDLVALTQLRMPTRAKLELARNYWDEMGRGKEPAMHGPMLDGLVEVLGIGKDDYPVVWEARAVGSVLAGLAANRHYAYHSIGALGAVELTAPDRAAAVNHGLQRLGFDSAARRYYAVHAAVDVRHSREWNDEVIEPLVRENPALARPIAEGALMRLNAGARSFARYRRHFRVFG